MRVLLVVEASAAGTGRHVLDLAQGLVARGIDTHLLYATHRIDKIFAARLEKIAGLKSGKLKVYTNIGPRDFLAWRAIRRYAKQNGPFDIIHGHSSKGGALARLAALGTRARAIYTIHGLVTIDKHIPIFQRTAYFSIEWTLSKISARIIAVAPEEQRAAIAAGFGRDRVICIPNGIEPLELTPRTIARQTMGVSDDAIIVGFIGRLVDQKAPHVLVQAFAKSLEVAPTACLAMVGGGPLDESLKELAATLNVADRVIWLGPRDAREVLAGFDLFALSSRKEGLPYVVLEAMVTGMAIVATEASSVEILVRPGINGEIVPTDDVPAFAEALMRVMSDSQRLRRYGEESLLRSKFFSIDEMVENTLAAYRDVLAERDGVKK